MYLEILPNSFDDLLNYFDSVNYSEFVDNHIICENFELSFFSLFVPCIYLSIGLFCQVKCNEKSGDHEKRAPFLVPDNKENTCYVLPLSVMAAVGLLVKEVSLILNSVTCFSPSVEIILLFLFICHFNKFF